MTRRTAVIPVLDTGIQLSYFNKNTAFEMNVPDLFINITIIALFTIIRTDRNMLLACYSHKHISYRIRTIIRRAIKSGFQRQALE
ncbi:hypothetical protein [Wolbachia endosymbiont (group A) of Scambus nigricans]|uniref:hypothetical protein n=1 Tax=Wolbachia endosymbiont (group A) of Scambus nigricans TaxID=2954055 RepID=UPI0022304F4F|nr:hypothetical protein [Wolbachia endosymbiont (group A) of Scambus nigricans]